MEALLNAACASPSGSDDYQELLYLEDYTMNYIFKEFLKGGQTGLRAQTMLRLMGDIAPTLTSVAPETASSLAGSSEQARFDAILRNVEQAYEQYGDIWLRENLTYGWKLMRMVDPLAAIPPFDVGSLDIDGDGIEEQYAITLGPTSGLFTFRIQATVNGETKYLNAFDSHACQKIYFETENDTLSLVTVDFQGTEKKYTVTIADGNIVLTDAGRSALPYWGPQGPTK